MGQPRLRPPSADDPCFACSGAIGPAELAVHAHGAWFHLPCYDRVNNFPNAATAVPQTMQPEVESPSAVKRLIAWITDTSPREGAAKDPVAVELGRRGGLKGGRARAERLSPARRTAIARQAAQARWDAMKER